MAAKRVLIFSPYANWLVHLQVDAFLALALRLRGVEVRFLTCDRLYAHCPAVKGRQDCGTCLEASQTVPKALLLTPEPLNAAVDDGDEARAVAWIDQIAPADYPAACFEGAPVGDWALSSALTQLRSTPEDLLRRPASAVYRRYIIDTLKTYWAVDRIIEEFRPDRMLLFSGRFYPYRAAVEACRRRGVAFAVHERGFAPDSFLFMENRSVLDLSVYRDLYREWRDVALPAATLERLGGVFDGRKSGSTINQYPFHSFSERQADIRRQLGIPPGKRMVGVFTSSFDELYSCDDYESIDDQVGMLEALFDYYRDRDVYVVVRHHPYIGGTSYDIAERSMLCRYYRNALDAPSNVRIIMPKEKIVSYDLFPHLDYAVAPYSTIAVELALDGAPAAVHALTPHAEAFPFTFSRMTREEIFALCDRMETSAGRFDPAAMRAALRYADVQYLLFSWNFAGMGIRNHFVPDLRITHTDELLPGHDPTLDAVCAHLADGAPLHRHPGEEDLRRSSAEENAFLTARIGLLAAARAQAAIDSAESAAVDGEVAALSVAAVRVSTGGSGRPAGIERWARRSVGVDLRCVDIDADPAAPGAILAVAAATVAALTADYVLLHTDRDQYDERAVAYAAAALAGDAGLSCAVFGTWLARDGGVLGYLPADRLTETLPLLPDGIGGDPYLPLAVTVWRRDAFLAFAAAAANDDTATLAARLPGVLSGGGVRVFPEALAMVWL